MRITQLPATRTLLMGIGLQLVLQLLAAATMMFKHHVAYPSPNQFLEEYEQVFGSPRMAGIPNRGTLPFVRMLVEDSVHYRPGSDREWDALLPPRAFSTSPRDGPFTIALFHQLHCLNVLRIDFARLVNDTLSPSADQSLRRHCMNYLRQTALCHADLHLEPITEADNTERTHEYMCRDWTLIYKAVESAQSS